MLSAAAVFAAAVSLLRLQLFWLLSAGAAFGVSSEYQLSTTWPPIPASLRRGLAWSCRLALGARAWRRCSLPFCRTAGPQHSGINRSRSTRGGAGDRLRMGPPETRPFILWFRPQFRRAFAAADILSIWAADLCCLADSARR